MKGGRGVFMGKDLEEISVLWSDVDGLSDANEKLREGGVKGKGVGTMKKISWGRFALLLGSCCGGKRA